MTSADRASPRGRRVVGLSAAMYGGAGVALLTNIVLTHAMSAGAFGAYRYVIAAIGLVAVAGNFGLPYTAAKLLVHADAVHQLRIIGASTQLVFIALTLAAVVLAGFALSTWSLLAVSPLLLAAAGLMWTVGLQRHFMYALRGTGRTRQIALQASLPPAILLVFACAMALTLHRVPLIAALTASGAAYAVAHVATTSRLSLWRQHELKPERAEVLRGQRTVGLPIYKGAIVSVGIAELIVVLGGAYIGARGFGTFSLAQTLAAPVASFPVVVGMVQFRRFGSLTRIPRSLVAPASGYSAALAFVGVSAGWLIFPLIFPSSFALARIIFPLLSATYLLHGVGDYLNQFLQARGEGAAIKHAAYIVGVIDIVVSLAAIPTLGIWGLVITRSAGSVSYFVCMATLAKRGNRDPE